LGGFHGIQPTCYGHAAPSVGGKIARERSSDDPANELQALLQAWVYQAVPGISLRSTLTKPRSTAHIDEPRTGDSLTNIGNCLPDTALFATDKGTMVDLDTKFANMTFVSPGKGTRLEQIGLPQYLSDTMILSHLTRRTSKTGVLSYAVAYPRWIDPDAAPCVTFRVPFAPIHHIRQDITAIRDPRGSRFYGNHTAANC